MPGKELTKDEAKKELEQDLAQEKAKLQRQKEAQLPQAEQKRLEDERKAADEKRKAAEAQAEKDAELLKKKDEELTDEAEKKRKAELVKQPQEADEKKRKEAEDKLSAEEKIKRVKDEAQKRIDELTNKLKQVEDKHPRETEALKEQIKTLEEKVSKLSPPATEDIAALAKKEEQERIAKYLEEDKSKPREERREMSKQELDEWIAEDFASAQVWLTERTGRRSDERKEIRQKQEAIVFVKNLKTKQEASTRKIWEKYPELNINKRQDELKAEGKSPQEAAAIICAENEKHRICSELYKADSNKYTLAENGPELLVADMEKQLSSKSSQNTDEKDKRIEELSQKVEELTALIEGRETEDIGVTSTVRSKRTSEQLTEKEKQLVETAKEMGLPQENIDAAVKKLRAGQGKG
jgi:hypothetical protein